MKPTQWKLLALSFSLSLPLHGFPYSLPHLRNLDQSYLLLLSTKRRISSGTLFCTRPTCSCRRIFSERLLHNAAAHCVLTACRAAHTGSAAKWLQPPPQEASSTEVLDLEGFLSSRNRQRGRVKPDLCVWSIACWFSQMRLHVIVSSVTP